MQLDPCAGQSNTTIDELPPDDPNSIIGKLSRLKVRQTRLAQQQQQQQPFLVSKLYCSPVNI